MQLMVFPENTNDHFALGITRMILLKKGAHGGK
jgi:hypothetical protein